MRLILVTCILATLVLSIQCRPHAVQFFPFQPQPFPTPYLLAPGSNVNLHFPSASLLPYGGGSGFPGDSTLQLIPSDAFPPHPFSRVPKMMSMDSVPTQANIANPIKLVDGRAQTRKQKQPKRLMSAPFEQTLQQSDKKFKIEKHQLVLAKQQQPARIVYEPAASSMNTQQAPAKLRAAAPDQRVVVTATGSTAADRPVPRAPLAPTVDDIYPIHAAPTTNNYEEASLILEPSSKAISGNGGTAISTPISHAILKHGSSTRILFRPQSVAIVGANGRAHAQADLIVDYVN